VNNDDHPEESNGEAREVDNDSGSEMMHAKNEVDMEIVIVKIKEHDPEFDFEKEQPTIYKENVYYFRLAKNVEEEKEYDAYNIEAYLIINSKTLYCIDLDSYTWAFNPVPIN
jgi:hypothetical protein